MSIMKTFSACKPVNDHCTNERTTSSCNNCNNTCSDGVRKCEDFLLHTNTHTHMDTYIQISRCMHTCAAFVCWLVAVCFLALSSRVLMLLHLSSLCLWNIFGRLYLFCPAQQMASRQPAWHQSTSNNSAGRQATESSSTK